MILDDENKLVQEIQNNAFEMMCCEKLGQIYMTKHGDLGYVWDIKPDGTPKIIMRTSSEYIKLSSLYEIEKSIKNFEKKHGWYIPTEKQFLESISWRNESKYNISVISENMLNRAKTQCNSISREYNKKFQPHPLVGIDGAFWLKSDENTYNLNTYINIASWIPEVELQHAQDDYYAKEFPMPENVLRKILFLRNLGENEIQSYEESENMIQETIHNLPLGRF